MNDLALKKPFKKQPPGANKPDNKHYKETTQWTIKVAKKQTIKYSKATENEIEQRLIVRHKQDAFQKRSWFIPICCYRKQKQATFPHTLETVMTYD